MRKKLLLSLLIFLSFCYCIAQQKIQDARQKSWQSLVYKIPADSAGKYAKEWEIAIDTYLGQSPFTVWDKNIEHFELLPPGNYLIVSVEQNELVATYYCKSNIQILPINNQRRLQFELRDTLGNSVAQADVWMNDKKLAFDTLSRTYAASSYKADEAIIKVVAGKDTSFFELTALENFTRSRWYQWWSNLYYRKPVYVISAPVRFAKKMITNKPANWFRNRRYFRNAENGYVIFSQPKYKPGDTLRTKAYIINRKGKQYKKRLDLLLSYISNGKYYRKQLTKLSPVSPGAYIYEFPLGDSLDADRNYQLIFQDKKERTVLTGGFKIEDYLLDEVTSYSLRSEKEHYYQHDTLVFYASAKDANGLSLMDGRAKLNLIAKSIPQFYKQQVWVPDTLWQLEKPLVVEGETRFEIPASSLPEADLDIEVTAEFRNSNNEIQEKEISVKLSKSPGVIRTVIASGYITAEYLQNGKSISINGMMGYGNNAMERAIQFPFREKVHPFAEEYEFWIENEQGKLIAYESIEIEKTADVIFNRVQIGDSAGFSLYNPLKAQVIYNVLYGNKVIASGSDTSENITWIEKFSSKKIYNVVWNYNWGGKEYKGNNSVALLSRLLNTSIEGAENIYPGQTDTITIRVKDYKGNPAAGVNLTAVSYNTQFSKDIRVPEPPYQQRYKYRKRLLMDDYELETVNYTVRKFLGDHQRWRKLFGLDTMLYYKMLFPDGKFSPPQLIQDFVPQLSVHVVQKGVPQEVYLLYLNRKLVWYNGVTDKPAYAFSIPPGYIQVGFRLKDKYVEIDSVYVQPYYKHDIVFDLDHLPANTKIISQENEYSFVEQSQLERQIFRIANEARTAGGYIWQHNQLVHLSESKSHITGPFETGDSLQFFKPGAFDIKFVFEPGYEYSLSPKMARMEKKSLFPQKGPVRLHDIKKAQWILGDTIPVLPVIQYKVDYQAPYLFANDHYHTKAGITGAIFLQLPEDSTFTYAVLYNINPDSNITRIKNSQFNQFSNVIPGNYNLVFITKAFQFMEVENIKVSAHTTTCIKIDNPIFVSHNSFVETLHLNQLKKPLGLPANSETIVDTEYTPVISGEPMPKGNASITGVVTDKEGKSPIPGVAVTFKGYNSGTSTHENGRFSIQYIQPGVYTLIASAVGYETKTLQVSLQNYQTIVENIELKMLSQALEEVVVTAYGVQKKSNITGSISIVSAQSITQTLQGKVAGVQVINSPGAASDIILRGSASLDGNTKPLYIINGAMMDELPDGLDIDGLQMSVLKGDMAVNLYGSRAANGVIIINTAEFAPKSVRDNFKDNAIWQPNLITAKDGKVSFVSTYPDNITSWQTFVVGMDKKKRITKTSTIVKSFKPMLAQLAMPQFLVEGDSAILTGKLINYTNAPVAIKSLFGINSSNLHSANHLLKSKEAINEYLPVSASGDTVKAEYILQLSNGYADGELRKIPVYKKGIEEAKGIFRVLNADTSFVFTPDTAAGKTIVHIQDNPLDMLLDELKQLREYPYYCMEQTASKLRGLLLEKQIRKTLGQPFEGEKQIQALLNKLQKAQLFDGGWSWWPGGAANLPITNYITRALLLLKDDVLVQTNLRNATLYLQHILPRLKREALPDVLYTLSEAGHIMDFSSYLRKIKFDSLTIHDQWLIVGIKQKQQMSYDKEKQVVMSKKIETMLGGMHWGEDSHWWQHNEVATTVLAFTILQRENKLDSNLQKVSQYFLERRGNGRWRNTVESASISAAILPMLLQLQPKYNLKPVVTIEAGNTTTVNKFPYIATLQNNGKPVQFTKQGGGMMYVTAWQKNFNADPEPVKNNFMISSSFEKAGMPATVLRAGEKVVMKITVNVLKDAEYVLIEIPIPAGCTYADKPQSWNTHKEFLKDKLVIFVESMPKGKYEYDIELEPRYSGKYHLNPAKAELMYFPVFYGRNELKQVEIIP